MKIREGYVSNSLERAKQRAFEDSIALKDTDRKAMTDLFKKNLSIEEVLFFKKIIKDFPCGKWATEITEATPMGFHLLGGGIAVRNFFRSNGFDEKTLGIQNLDNVYIDIIEDAVNSIPD